MLSASFWYMKGDEGMAPRVIPCAITAEYVSGDGVTLGVAGSFNSVAIEYDFRSAGPQWDGTTKYVLWTNPQGTETNRVNLGADKLVPGHDDVYQASPTADAMSTAGWCEMVVVGVVVDTTTDPATTTVKVKTKPSRFRVLSGERQDAENEGIAASVADQLQTEIDAVAAAKVSKPVSPYDENGEEGQILMSLGDGSTQWAGVEIVEEILQEHPEWLVPVEAGGITTTKIADGAVTSAKLADSSVTRTKLASAVIGELDGLSTRVTAVEQNQTSPYNFKGSVSTLADLPSSGNTINDTYYVEDEKYRVTWNGSAWSQSSLDESDYEDELAGVRSDLGDISERTRNFFYLDNFRKNGVNVSFNNGMIVMDGTASNGTYANLPEGLRYNNSCFLLPAGTYRFLLAPADGGTLPLGIDFRYNTTPSTTGAVGIRPRASASITFDSDVYVFLHLANSGDTFENYKFMVYVAVEEDVNNYIPPESATDYVAREEVRGLISRAPLCLDFDTTHILRDGTNYDTLMTPGVYACTGMNRAATMVGAPFDSAHLLYVIRANSPIVGDRMLQIAVPLVISPSFSLRYYDGSSWHIWNNVANRHPINSTFARKLNYSLSNLKKTQTALTSSLPKNTGEVGNLEYYDVGTNIPGVLYSSVWRDGLDVYRNLTLETYYSAMANPASVMYTKAYTDRNIYNGHAWYGGVCSSFTAYATGQRFYMTTDALRQTLEDKPDQSGLSLDIGDLIVTEGHIVMVTEVFCDENGAFSGVNISEQTRAGEATFRTRYLSRSGIDNYIRNNDATVKLNPNPQFILPPADITYSAEVLFERGNNTYITADDIASGAWFYIPNASSIYWKKDDGEYQQVLLSGYQTDTVNGVTVYDLSPLFTGVGNYSFTDSLASEKDCLIKVIDIGTIVLEDNVLTLSGWENCVPYNYYIVKETATSSETPNRTMDPTDGYVCLYTNQCGEIAVEPDAQTCVVTLPAAYTTNDRYKIWVEFDTGIGLKQAFSNLWIRT